LQKFIHAPSHNPNLTYRTLIQKLLIREEAVLNAQEEAVAWRFVRKV
jgi:hypothetical protein